MQREIKFRAWDKNKNKFIPTNTWAVCKIDSNSQALAIMIEDWENYIVGEYMYEHAQEIQQFTGVKDKTGKDIYEGDILKLGNNEKVVVYFKSAKFLGIRKNGTVSLTSFYWIYAEIIGNIYENPELLNN